MIVSTGTFKKKYLSARLLHGVFYLIDIRRPRIDDKARRQAEVFKRFIGDGAWPNVFIIYTHGASEDSLDPQHVDKRTKQVSMMDQWRDDVSGHAKAKGANFVELALDSSGLEDTNIVPTGKSREGLDLDNSPTIGSRTKGSKVDMSHHTHHPAEHTQGNHSIEVYWHTRR
jgi:hypothetical protein